MLYSSLSLYLALHWWKQLIELIINNKMSSNLNHSWGWSSCSGRSVWVFSHQDGPDGSVQLDLFYLHWLGTLEGGPTGRDNVVTAAQSHRSSTNRAHARKKGAPEKSPLQPARSAQKRFSEQLSICTSSLLHGIIFQLFLPLLASSQSHRLAPVWHTSLRSISW